MVEALEEMVRLCCYDKEIPYRYCMTRKDSDGELRSYCQLAEIYQPLHCPNINPMPRIILSPQDGVYHKREMYLCKKGGE